MLNNELTPVRMFLERDSVVYSGTSGKVESAQKHIDRFLLNHRDELPFQLKDKVVLEQMAIPTEEPNELIDQCSLMMGKSLGQVKTLKWMLENYFIRSSLPGIVVPSFLAWMDPEGGSFAFVANDVGIRERNNGVWKERRNFFYDKSVTNPGQMRSSLLKYYDEIYGEMIGNERWYRAVDSAAALVTVKVPKVNNSWEADGLSDLSSKIYPANSTAGVRFDRHPLFDKSNRNKYLDFVIDHFGRGEEYGLKKMQVAGAMRTELAVLFSRDQGIDCQVYVPSRDTTHELQILEEHVVGFAYPALRDLLLTFANPKRVAAYDKGDKTHFPIQIYPKGCKYELSVH